MSVGATDAVARVAAIQQMVTQLTTGGESSSSGFASALQSAQQASGTTAATPVSSVSGMPYAAEITAAARKYNLDPALLAGLVKQESGFNPSIRSAAGATGLTQLMPATAASLGVTDSTDPVQNLDGGARYLRQQLDRFGGDERLALAAYNAGPGAVQKYGGIPPYAETQNYVAKVLANRDAYAASGLGATAALASTAAASAGVALPTASSAAGVQSTALSTLATALDSPSTAGPTGSSSSLGYPTT